MDEKKMINTFDAKQPQIVPLEQCVFKFAIHGEKFASYEDYVAAYKKMGKKYMRDKILWEELHITGVPYNKLNEMGPL